MLKGTEADTLLTVRANPIRSFLLVLTAYFFLHLILRINLSDSLELDEAEAVFYSQQLRLGYGSQPPLYAWLQWVMFSIFGINLFALSALKNLLLLATYLSMFYTAKPLVGEYGAMTPTVSLILFPQIGWESQRDLTHSVLLTAMASATLWCYFALLRKPTISRYILFGLLIGLGLQTKYNFALFLAGLICASLLVTEHRHLLSNQKVAATLAVVVLVLLPHLLWLADNLHAATSPTLRKMAEGAQDADYLRNVATGFLSLVQATFSFAAPVAIVYWLICRRYWKQISINWHSPQARFFLVLYGSFIVFLSVLVLTGEVGKIKDRWMQPLFFSLPLAFLVLVPSLPREELFRRIVPVSGFVAIAVLLMLPLRMHLGPLLGKHVRLHHPYPELAAELARRFPEVNTVVADGTLVAGNLHFQNPTLRTLSLDDVLKRNTQLEGEILLVAQDNKTPPVWIKPFRLAYPEAEVRHQGSLMLNYRFGGKESISFNYVHVVIRSR